MSEDEKPKVIVTELTSTNNYDNAFNIEYNIEVNGQNFRMSEFVAECVFDRLGELLYPVEMDKLRERRRER